MRNLTILLFLSFLCIPAFTSAQIWQENFDGSNPSSPPTFSYQNFCTDQDYLDIVCNDGGGCANAVSSDFIYNGASGQYLGARHFNDAVAGCFGFTFGGETVTFSGINISSCTFPSVPYVCFKVAESRNMNGDLGSEWGASAGAEDTWDGDSSVKLFADIDGNGPTQVTAIEAFNGSDTRPGIDINCNGKSNDAGEPELTDMFTEYCFELPALGNLLELEFNLKDFTTTGEDIAIDDISVHCGDGGLSGTLLPACTPFTAVNPAALFVETFEGASTAFAGGCGFIDARDYFGVACLSGGPCSPGATEIDDAFVYFGTQGSFYGARDYDKACANQGQMNGFPEPVTVTAGGIDISSCGGGNSLYLCFDAAESSAADSSDPDKETLSNGDDDTWDGSSDRLDRVSFLTFFSSIDGGDEEPIFSITASGGNNSGPAVDADLDGTGEGAEITSTFTTFCAEIPSLGGNMDLSFTIGGLGSGGDDIAIDNIQVICGDETDLPVPPTFVTIPTLNVLEYETTICENEGTVLPLIPQDVNGFYSISPDPAAPIPGASNTFSSRAILVNTGEIDITQLDPTVTYTVTFMTTAWPQEVTTDITIIPIDDVAFAYQMNACASELEVLPMDMPATSGGTYTIDPPATIDATSGAITLNPTMSGQTFTITYATTSTAGCPNQATSSITIDPADEVEYNYPANACVGDGPIIPTIVQAGNGTFSISPSATINPTTGEITVTPAMVNQTFTITYSSTAAGDCLDVETDNNIVTISPADDVAFNYESNVCASETNISPTDMPATTGGTYTIDPPATIDATSGAITLDPTMSGQTFTITYATTSTAGCPNQATSSITIDPADEVEYNYQTNACVNDGTITPNIIQAGSGTFSISPSATINPTTGEVTVTPAMVNQTFTITYSSTAAGDCSSVVTSNNMVTINPADDVAFNYESNVCASETSISPTDMPATTGGTYSISPFATINGTTGAITLSSTTPGQSYTVSYMTTSPGGCPNTATDVIMIDPADEVEYNYQANACVNDGTITPTILQGGSGTFSISPIAQINSTTGEITVTPAMVNQTFTITYSSTAAGDCSSVITSNNMVTINPADDVIFEYQPSVCASEIEVLPTDMPATSGGTYTIDPPATIDGTTGAIDISSTIPGQPYTITYASMGVCANTATSSIIIEAADEVEYNYPTTACVDAGNVFPDILQSGNGSFSISPNNAFIDPSTGEISVTPDLAGQTFTITYTINGTGGCSTVIANNSVVEILSAPAASISASSQSVCEGEELFLDAIINNADNGVVWTTNGDGFFDPETTSSTLYTPGSNDVANGFVTLTITAPTTNGCPSATDFIEVNVVPAPTVDIGDDFSICDANSVDLEGVLGGSATAFTWNTSGDGAFSDINAPNVIYTFGPNDLLNESVTIIANPNNPFAGCTPEASTIVITINASPNSGIATSPAPVCNMGSSVVDLNTLLIDEALGGIWTGITSSTGLSGNLFDPNGQTPGTYIFRYTVSSPDCPDAFTEVLVNVNEPNTATLVTSTSVCSNSSNGNNIFVNFNDLITTGDMGGTWENTDGIGVDLSNLNNVSFDGIDADTYIFTYTTTANGDCTGQAYTTSIVVEDCVCPTVFGNEDYDGCEGDGYEVTVNGVVYNQGNRTGMQTLTSLVSGCDSIVDINLVFEINPNAGDAGAPVMVCNENSSTVDLNTLISNADPSGTWTETTTLPSSGLSGNQFDPSGQTAGTYTFRYTVTGTNCPDDFTEVSVTVDEPNTAALIASTSVCSNSNNGNISAINFNDLITAGDINGTWEDTGGSGVDLNNLANVSFDGIAVNTYIFTYTTPSNGDCPGEEYTTSVLVEDCVCPSVNGSEFYDGCEGDGYEVTVNDVVYNQGNRTGMETLTSVVSGCDSIVNIVLVFDVPPNAGDAGEPVMVCNENSSAVDLNTLISNADPGGTWTETTTPPSSGLSGSQFDPSGQAAGTYTFRYTVVGTNCPDDFTEVSVTVDEPNTAVLVTSSNVCNNSDNGNISVINFNDLIIAGDANGTWNDTDMSMVDLTDLTNVSFDGIAAGTYIFTYTTSSNGDCAGQEYTTSIIVEDCVCPTVFGNEDYAGCEGDGYEVTVNGVVYNEDNRTGMQTLTSVVSGCDSIVDINLIFEINPNAGDASAPVMVCNENSSAVDLNTLISNADPGGTWTETTTPPSSGLSGSQFDPSGQAAGIYTFRYTVVGTNCPDDFTEVSVTVDEPNTVVLVTSSNVCNNSDNGNISVINFNDLITAGDASGTWNDTDMSMVDLTDLTNVSFDGIAAGTYIFTYTTTSNGDCAGQEYTTSIIVEDCVCPTVFGNEDYAGCEGDGYEVTVNGVVYNEGNRTGMQTLTSVVSGCDSIVDINLVFEINPNAGLALDPVTACNTGSSAIDLSTLLTGADAGGIWTETTVPGSSGLSGNQFDPNGQAAGTYTFRYTVAGTNCPDDFAEVSVIVDGPNTATLIASSSVCNNSNNGNISFINFTELITSGDASGVWIDVDGSTVDLSDLSNVSFDGVAAGTYTFTYTTSTNGTCAGTEYTTSIIVEDCSCPTEFGNEDYAGCEGDGYEVVVNNVTYNEGNAMGTETLTSLVSGCDSIVTINLVFAAPNTATVDEFTNICNNSMNGNITVINFNNLITAGDATGVWIEVGGATVNLADLSNVSFDGVAAGTYTFTYTTATNGTCAGTAYTTSIIVNDCSCPTEFGNEDYAGCEGDGYEVIVNNVTYNEGNAMGTETLINPISGCDSIVTINLVFAAPNTAMVDASASVCNNSDNGNISVININDLITAGDASGNWVEVGGPTVDLADLSNVSFDGVAAGTYTFTYTTATNGTCAGTAYTTSIIVNDCSCPTEFGNEDYAGCEGDGYEVIVNNVTYNEGNAMGTETLTSLVSGCDSIVTINLVFAAPNTATVDEFTNICNNSMNGNITVINFNDLITSGDATGVWIEVGGATVDLADLSNVSFDGVAAGTYTFTYTTATNGTCAGTAYTTSIIVNDCSCPTEFGNEDYAGCQGDGYEVVVNNVTYNEGNAMGTETLTNPISGCDSIVTINLVFAAPNTAMVDASASVCNNSDNGNISVINFSDLITAGDASGNWVEVGGPTVDLADLSNVSFDGVAAGTYTFTYTTSTNGTCAGTEYTTSIIVEDCSCPTEFGNEDYAGCEGDGYEVEVDNIIYNEANPTGTATLLSSSGCDSIVTINLVFDIVPTIEIGDDRSVCIGESIDLTATLGGGATTATWSSSGDGSFSNQTLNTEYMPGPTDLVNGSVEVSALSENVGSTCFATDMITLTFGSELSGSIVGGGVICNGESTEITFELSGGNVYNIVYNDGMDNTFAFFDVSDGFSVTVNPTVSTTYTLDVVSSVNNTCLATIPNSTISVTVEPLGTIATVTSDVAGFGVSCNGFSDGEITITPPTSGTAPFNYTLSNGSTSLVTSDLDAGLYSINITDAMGCMEEVEVTITEPAAVSLASSTTSPDCSGDENGAISIDGITGGNGTYVYSIDDAPFQVADVFPIVTASLEPGVYAVIVQDSEGCETETSINVPVSTELEINLGQDTSIFVGDIVELAPLFNFDPVNILWTSTLEDGCTNCIDQSVSPASTSTYMIFAEDSLGCNATAEILITVDGGINIPDGFSPNDDGLNDVWIIPRVVDFPNNQLVIVNRWGNIVFEIDNYQNDWNGTTDGNKPLPEGTYYYTLKLDLGEGEVRQGSITIIR